MELFNIHFITQLSLVCPDCVGFPACNEYLDVDVVDLDKRVPQARATSDLAPATFQS